jgi:protein tyrosine phosphatase (PTP) superfamily phosphohydrolase (DUF442 family)
MYQGFRPIRILTVSLVSCLVALSLCGAVRAADADNSASQRKREEAKIHYDDNRHDDESEGKKEVEEDDDLPNFRSLHPYLYCGGKPSEEGLYKLKAKGVTTVINLRKTKRSIESEKLLCEKLGIGYLSLPIAHDGPTKAQVDALLKEARLAKASYNPETKKAMHAVYVHCSFGEDRTGCLIGIYRMVEDGWCQADALNEMHKYGFNLDRKGLWDVFDSYSVKDASK